MPSKLMGPSYLSEKKIEHILSVHSLHFSNNIKVLPISVLYKNHLPDFQERDKFDAI